MEGHDYAGFLRRVDIMSEALRDHHSGPVRNIVILPALVVLVTLAIGIPTLMAVDGELDIAVTVSGLLACVLGFVTTICVADYYGNRSGAAVAGFLAAVRDPDSPRAAAAHRALDIIESDPSAAVDHWLNTIRPPQTRGE